MSRVAGRWNQRVGRAAEELATGHLRRRGCRVLARRYRSRRGEIDLIVRDGETIAFVEVKARSSRSFGSPLEALTPRKRARLRATARRYLLAGGHAETDVRFDVVAVHLGSGRARVEWVRDAF